MPHRHSRSVALAPLLALITAGPLLIGIGATAVTTTTARTPPNVFVGTVGSAPVVMVVDSKSWIGAYFYTKQGQDIPLRGAPNKLEELDPNTLPLADAEVKAVFAGSVSTNGQSYTGTWSAKNSSKTVPFALQLQPASTAKNAAAVVAKRIRSATAKNASNSFKVTYALPVASSLKPSWINTRITENIRAAALFGSSVDAALAEVKSGYGIVHTSYSVTYNAHSLLSVQTHTETEAAYPDQHDSFLVFDLTTGTELGYNDLFTPSGKESFRKVLQTQLDRNIAARAKLDPAEGVPELVKSGGANLVSDTTLDTFTIAKTGIAFHHDFGFNHATKALEPDGELKTTWSDLATFLSPNVYAELSK